MKKRKRRPDEETTYWLSYSDMMAGLLLTFVLIISFTMLHAKMQYDEKQTELIGKEQELSVRSEELEEERRLFYVAMTRAKTYLFLYSLRELYKKDATVSRYIGELKDDSGTAHTGAKSAGKR